MAVPISPLASARHLRRWLLTLIVSILAVFVASYFYFTAIHAFEVFDTGSCTPLDHTSPPGKCVSSLQKLLNDDRPYPKIAIDGHFGVQTKDAVMNFQYIHQLAVDGVVADETASALNEFSPRPGILTYAAGFTSSRLAMPAKLWAAILLTFVIIICLVLRGACAGYSGVIRVRARTGLFTAFFAADSAATDRLMANAHGWAATSLCVILTALSFTLLALLVEMFSSLSASSASADLSSQEIQPQIMAGYGG